MAPVLPRASRSSLPPLAWIVLLLAFVEAGWFLLDGARALLVGDYLTPSHGPHTGQLGPWADLVRGLGIEPRSLPMKLVHVGLGSAWILGATCFLLQLRGGWEAMLLCAIMGLWYVPFGTILGVLQILLLLHPRLRAARV